MCVTCLSEEQDASLLSTRHVTLRKTIAQEKHNINTLYKLKQTIERCLFNSLDLLRCYVKKDKVIDRDLWDTKEFSWERSI
jgi:hypothetical protein